jgi:hypothetical protein
MDRNIPCMATAVTKPRWGLILFGWLTQGSPARRANPELND